MGCSSSKDGKGPNKKSKSLRNIYFKTTHVYDFDQFLEATRRVLVEFADLVDPLEDAMDHFKDITGFWRHKNASNYFLILTNY
jgi:hypothetical protein